MINRKIDQFLPDYFNTNKNALLVTGARQIGKTHSIREFGKSFDCFVEINFIETPEATGIFNNANGANDILLRLSAMTNKKL